MKHFVEIYNKEKYSKHPNENAKHELESVGLKKISDVVVGTKYGIDGDFPSPKIEKIAKDLLCDNVMQTSSVSARKIAKYNKVEVWLKESATDVVGESVKEAITKMGIKEPQKVRVGNIYFVKGSFAKKDLETAVKKSFVNEVVNKFSIN